MTAQVWRSPQVFHWLVCAILLALLSISSAAHAHRKTDVITLYNGDRLTGEIISLLSGRLVLNTDAMGNVSIEWKEIASVESNFNYELRIEDGQRFFGTIGTGSIPGTFTIVDVFGERSFAGREIVELRPVEEQFTRSTK